MHKLFENWRRFLSEDESTVPARKNVPKKKKPPVPPYVEAWRKQNGFQLLSTSRDLYGYLGGGAQGKVYSMAKDGREYAVKFTEPFGRRVDEEREILQRIKKIQDRDPVIKRHTVNIYGIDEIIWPLVNPHDGVEGEVPVYVYVVERLKPLSDTERKYFDDMNIGKDKMLNSIFFEKGYRGWNKVRAIFIDILASITNEDLTEKYETFARMDGLPKPNNDDYGLIQKEIEKIGADLVYSFDKARDGLSKSELEDNQVFVDFIETPSIVHKKNLYEFYTSRMLATDSGQKYIERIMKLFGGKLDEEILLKDFIFPALRETFDKLFMVSIPIIYTDVEDSKTIGLQKQGPMKSLHQALMRLWNKYEITPYDLHDENVMKRGDDLVVSDLGFFR